MEVVLIRITRGSNKIKPRERPGANSLIKCRNHNHMKRSRAKVGTTWDGSLDLGGIFRVLGSWAGKR